MYTFGDQRKQPFSKQKLIALLFENDYEYFNSKGEWRCVISLLVRFRETLSLIASFNSKHDIKMLNEVCNFINLFKTTFAYHKKVGNNCLLYQ